MDGRSRGGIHASSAGPDGRTRGPDFRADRGCGATFRQAVAPSATVAGGQPEPAPTRLIVQTGDLSADNITQFLEERGYDAEDDKLNAEKTTFLLRLIISIVMVVGLIISLLSLYILMLSIYLLVEKNAEKLQNLLLIGYRPSQVARPYQLLTIALNAVVLVLSILVVCLVRNYYIRIVDSLFPTASSSTLWPAIALGTLLFSIVTAVNLLVIQKKIKFL